MAENGNEIVQLGWKVPANVREQFGSFCNAHGGVTQEECAGALILWQYIPSEIREQAKMEAKGLAQVDKSFWLKLQEGLRQGWTERLDTLREKQGRKK